MSDSTIGIKVADGSYYPVIEADFRGTRKLVLTTVKDNQEKVQVDLYRGNGSSIAEARYIGSITIENIPPAAQGEPEIELLIGIDEDGQLTAEAFDKSTGERQRFDTSLAGSTGGETFAEPEFALEGESEQGPDFEEPPLTGEDYPVGEKDRREEILHRRGPNILLLVLFVVLGLALVGAVAYFVYRAISGPAVPPLPTTGAAAPAQPGAAPAPSAAPAAAIPAPAAAAAPAPASPASAAAAAPSPGSVTYRIKKGDTLWDISATYYRNPWLYPRLAKANSITNPDLIFAGTRLTIPEN
ncbi:MAG: Hsp70 family protein [Spirochaetia bacterium]